MKKALIGSGGHAREVQAQMGTHLKRFVHDDYWEMGDDDLLPLSQFDPNSYSILINSLFQCCC